MSEKTPNHYHCGCGASLTQIYKAKDKADREATVYICEVCYELYVRPFWNETRLVHFVEKSNFK